MEINNIQVCNVCLRSSDESAGAVFIKAMKTVKIFTFVQDVSHTLFTEVVMSLNQMLKLLLKFKSKKEV